MNTTRPSSRSSNISSVSSSHAGPPRRAKIAAMAQMDISSISLAKPTRIASTTGQPPQQSLTMQQQMQQQPPRPRPAVKMRSSGSVSTLNSLSSRNMSSSPVPSSSRDMIITASATAPIVRNSKGGSGSVVGLSSGGSTVGGIRRIGTGSNNNLSASVVGGGGFVASVGKSTITIGHAGGRGGSARREGSVTSSDDGTVSEDSVEESIQLFSGGGGHHINGLPFGSSSLNSNRSSGHKIASTSSVVSAAGSGVGVRTRNSPSSVVSTASKPMRIAAGAAIKVDTPPSVASPPSASSGTTTAPSVSSISIPSLSASSAGLSKNGTAATNGNGPLSTSVSSSTSSSSLSWVSSPGQKNSNGYEPGSPTFTTPTSSIQQQQQQSFPPPPTPFNNISHNATQIRSATIKTPTSGAASVAAASKLAEENRRQEEAARTRRKIADLEISNTSLLQINQSLEATIRKQAAEMQELKMRMQSAQFGGDLSWMTSDNSIFSQDQDSIISTMNANTNPEAAVMIHELTEAERQADITFKRMCLIIDQMLFEAKQALDQSTKRAGVKVLSSFDMYEKEAQEEAHEDDLDAADQSIVIDDDEIDTIGRDGSSYEHAEQEKSMSAAHPTAHPTAATTATAAA